MEKISKFTRMTENSKKELLLYNSYIGENSLCKVVNSHNIGKILNGDIENISDNLKCILREKGIIVSDTINENKLLDLQYYRIASPHILRLIINPTEACNFACKYCYENHVLSKMTKKTQDDIVTYVGSSIQNYTGIHVSWFGGEPLVNMQGLSYISNRLIKICKFYKRKYTADITTNAYLLDYNTFNELLSYNIKKFQITIDGTKTLHDSQRILVNGKGTYDKIMENLNAIKNSTRRDFKILIRVNFTEKLYHVFDEFCKSIEDFISDNRFYISFFTIKDIEGTVDSELRKDILDNNKNPMRRIYDLLYAQPKSLNLTKDLLNPGMGLCYGGKKDNFVIKSDGSIYKCTIDFEDKNNQIGRLADGKMTLFDKYYNYISDRYKCAEYYSCFFAPVCTGNPCPQKGDNQMNCPFQKENIDVVLRSMDKYSEFKIVDGGI